MRFLLAADNFTRGAGGAARSAQELVRALLADGNRVAVLESAGRGGKTGWEGAELHRARLAGPLMPGDRDLRTVLLNPRWTERVSDLVAAFRPSLVVAQGMLAPGALRAARLHRVPAAYFFRGYAPLCPLHFTERHPEESCRRPDCWKCLPMARKLKYPLVRAALELYDRTVPAAELVVANSGYAAGLIERFWKVRAEVAPPALGLQPAGGPANDPDGYLLFVKPQKAKGLELIAELARRMPERRFAVAGELGGAAARTLGALANVEALGWREDMESVYRGARLLLGPSRLPEPFGRVFAEAASQGLPSVAFRTGGVPEAVGAGGVLLERSAGAETWAEAIEGLDGAARYEPLREAALAHARELAGGGGGGRLVETLKAAARAGPKPLPTPPDPGKKLKVVYVISALPGGGAELSLFHLASRLDRSRFEPQVVCTRAEGELAEHYRAHGVPVELVRLPSRYSPAGLLRLARFLAVEGADIVHTQMRRANTSGRIAAWLAGAPVTVTHIRNLPVDKSWRHSLVDRLLAPITSRIIAISPQVADAEHRKSGVPLERFAVLTNARDLSHFRPADRAEARRRLGLPENDFIVGFAGRLHPNKRLRVMLPAAARAAEQVPNLRVVLAGDGPLRAEMEELAAELGIAERVTFLGWQEDMAPVYPAMDVFCLISYIEGYGCALLEALACGVPAVATPVGYMAELLGDEEAGILVPVDEVEPAAEALVRLARDPELRERMGRAAVDAAGPHDIGEYVKKVERLYLECWAGARLQRGTNREEP